MRLTTQQIRRSNLFHEFLKRQDACYFEESSITKCQKCHTTGLANYKQMADGGSWDTASFCDNCNGIGYKGVASEIQIDLLNFVCKQCDGIGCVKCDHRGIVDWVTNIMG